MKFGNVIKNIIKRVDILKIFGYFMVESVINKCFNLVMLLKMRWNSWIYKNLLLELI